MVLLIIIPTSNGYFIGNINPTFSDKPIYGDFFVVQPEHDAGCFIQSAVDSGVTGNLRLPWFDWDDTYKQPIYVYI